MLSKSVANDIADALENAHEIKRSMLGDKTKEDNLLKTHRFELSRANPKPIDERVFLLMVLSSVAARVIAKLDP